MRTLLVSAVASALVLAAGCDSTGPLDPSASSMAQTNNPTTTTTTGAGGARGTTTTMGAGGGTTTTTGVAGSTAVSPTGTGGVSVAVGAGGLTQPNGAPLCDRPTGDRLSPTSLDDAKQIIHGTWLLCSNVGLFHQAQVGMYIGDDDRFVFLDLVAGQLVPKQGLANTGHLEYLDSSSFNGPGFNVQVNFVSDQGITIIGSPPIFSDDPRLMLINNEGVETYTYAAVRATPGGGTTDSGLPAGTIAQPAGASACARPTGDRLPVSSVPQMQQTIRGTWQLCSDVGLYHQAQAGIFIGDDDRYVFLDLVGGKLVPKTGLENKGHLEYLDNLQVNFVTDLSGFIDASPPIFSDDPRQLIINNEGVETYTYGRVP
jgi:hypothetical protein